MTQKMLKKAAVIGSTLALLASSATATFAQTIDVSGNGSKSDNRVDVDLNKRLDVNQRNDTDIRNDVRIEGNTGHNTANDNTGSDVNIRTGDTDARVDISNVAGSNQLRLRNLCGCDRGGDIRIRGNGSHSDNRINVDVDERARFDQNNRTRFDNYVDILGNTGRNRASDNTGGNDWDWWKDKDRKDHKRSDRNGEISIDTGDTDAQVRLQNRAGLNVLEL